MLYEGRADRTLGSGAPVPPTAAGADHTQPDWGLWRGDRARSTVQFRAVPRDLRGWLRRLDPRDRLRQLGLSMNDHALCL